MWIDKEKKKEKKEKKTKKKHWRNYIFGNFFMDRWKENRDREKERVRGREREREAIENDAK